MFGCLGRLVVVLVLLAAGAVAWLTRDRWLGRPATNAPSRAVSEWAPVKESGAGNAERALHSLGSPGGPVYVNVDAPDLLAYAVASLAGVLPPSVKDVQARVVGDRVYVRGLVTVSELGGAKVLGPLAAMLPARDTLEIGGTVDVVRPGLAQLHVLEMRAGALSIPSQLIPRLVHEFRRGAPPAGLAADALAVPLPPNVGDVRIARGKITLYKVAP